MEWALEGRGLVKSFDTTQPPTQVLRGVDLTVGVGEFVAIMGASGSGKSTLLHCLSGMDRPTAGQVILHERDLTSMSDAELAHERLHRMGFVFQQPALLPYLSIADNILLPALHAAPRRQRASEQRVQDLMSQFGIDHVADHGITQVSGGQLQRAAICRALVCEPTIVFADEPTGALNSSMSQSVMDAFEQVRQTGTAIVMVTHDEACAARADRIVEMSDGILRSGAATSVPAALA